MTRQGESSGDYWPDLETPGNYSRLVRLAARRLGSYHYLAEDVVSRALIKWRNLPSAQRERGRLEQVIKSEALSMLRYENRAQKREDRAFTDPALSLNKTSRADAELALCELRRAVAETCEQEQIVLTGLDIEFFELIAAGLTKTEIQRGLGATRHEIRRTTDKWKRILRLAMSTGSMS